jgi:RimJ/RimL family protein N-acetyltransferase
MRIVLRPLREDDLYRTYQWHGDPRNFDTLGGSFRYRPEDEALAYMRTWLKSDTSHVRLAIETEMMGEHVGNVSLVNIDPIVRDAHFHIFLDKSVRGKGLGFEATWCMLRHGFDDLNLNRVSLEVLEVNIPARRIYERCGFKEEGLRRDAAFKNGRFQNVIVMGCLSAEFVRSFFSDEA